MMMNFFELQTETIKAMLDWRISLEILLTGVAVFSLCQFLRRTDTLKTISGILFALLIFLIARLLNLRGIVWIYSCLSPVIMIALIIIILYFIDTYKKWGIR